MGFFSRRGRRDAGLLSVVIPAFNVEGWLEPCLRSVLASTYPAVEVIVIDDGSTDRTGAIADSIAAGDDRVTVLHTPNQGLGRARNLGAEAALGEWISFCDSDDVVPAEAFATLASSLRVSGSDFAAGLLAEWRGSDLVVPRWLTRLHTPPRQSIRVSDHPEIVGDVYAHTKLFRRAFWDREGFSWPVGVRYEDQPMLTEAYLRGTFDVLDDVVYHYRIREDGTSITQQRATCEDLRDRWTTKRMTWDAAQRHGDRSVLQMLRMRVLPGDLWRYFEVIPETSEEWWDLLVEGVTAFWGEHGSLTDTGLAPIHRLCGWLVEQDRREDAVALMTWFAEHGPPAPRTTGADGVVRLDIPATVLAPGSVAPEALRVR